MACHILKKGGRLQMRDAKQEDKVQAVLTLRFAGEAAFNELREGLPLSP